MRATWPARAASRWLSRFTSGWSGVRRPMRWNFSRQRRSFDVIYVPIGLGSSICGVAAARNALNLRTEIVGVTSAECPAYALSFKAAQAH